MSSNIYVRDSEIQQVNRLGCISVTDYKQGSRIRGPGVEGKEKACYRVVRDFGRAQESFRLINNK